KRHGWTIRGNRDGTARDATRVFFGVCFVRLTPDEKQQHFLSIIPAMTQSVVSLRAQFAKSRFWIPHTGGIQKAEQSIVSNKDKG
ncbi:MAG: hypothetical protein NTZ35_14880, partial [Ignavibacteriales bacterium]|nr:hypothetical protein [Ignavibacteriales bacterium]